MRSKLRQVLPHSLMLVTALLLYWAATKIDADTGGRIGPAAWPKAVIVFMALLCAYEIVKRLLAGSSFTATGLVDGLTQGPARVPSEVREEPARPPNYRMLGWGIALITAYVVLVPWIGFFLATFLFLAIFPLMGGYRHPKATALTALAGTLALFFVFTRIAYISLPLGDGPFRALSLALMRALGVS